MKNLTWVWWIVGLVLAYWLIVKKNILGLNGTKPGTNRDSTGTAVQPSPFWNGWFSQAQQATTATTNNVNSAVRSISDLVSGVAGLFGGASTATGPASPVTSGSGAGVPVPSEPAQEENWFDSMWTF
jgi:hypothetical protein